MVNFFVYLLGWCFLHRTKEYFTYTTATIILVDGLKESCQDLNSLITATALV